MRAPGNRALPLSPAQKIRALQSSRATRKKILLPE